jgi:hypothetical protein
VLNQKLEETILALAEVEKNIKIAMVEMNKRFP